ncbi:ABC transporter ATP-binding protein [Tessaracoccus rhinocerotis]|uniref:ABC transporter ATP-binding protein n=1 Tax=Tessaracoccus rhinocerotis TaxID=1689449 RepID=A0A553K0J3_9ACTN|nr:ABC transporter ATP-binding protein [Tessaracoccus rhinocerotis]TRY18221.1 ABC transporter ATP-binding protein [Tessaracoccus rhinocerotis]
MSTDKIVFDRVTATFEVNGQPFHAVKDLSLTIADNEFVTVVGPSGCGKSTIMNMAAGLLIPSGGEVRVDDRPVKGPGPERGVIFQQYALFPWLTVRQNVEFGLKLKKISRAQRNEVVERQLELTGLTPFADALPKTLSGGMKQRCAIARAYAADPSILLMDEPFGALDALTRVHMQSQLLETWRQEKRTVMFITHDVDEAVFLANRVIVMAARPGRIHRIIDVDLPAERTEDLRTSPEFTAIRNEVWNSVYHQDPPPEAGAPAQHDPPDDPGGEGDQINKGIWSPTRHHNPGP